MLLRIVCLGLINIEYGIFLKVSMHLIFRASLEEEIDMLTDLQ